MVSQNKYFKVEAYAYDNKGQVSHKSIYTDGGVPDLNLAYGYNLLGEVEWSNKQIGGETLYELYEYNVLGQLSELYSGNVPLNASNKSLYRRSTQSYTPVGQLQQNELNARRPSGSGNYSMRYQYDIRDRLTGINQLEYYATIEHFGAEYTYNATGQITAAKFQNPSTSNNPWTGDHRYIVTYYYDALNRLLQNTHRIVDNSWAINGYPTSKYQERLSYDANGNVLTLQRTNENAQVVDNLSMTYKSGTNQLQSVVDAAGANKLYGWDAGSTTNSYDLNGNILSGDGAANISYDVRNLPTSIEKNGKTITYRYNAAGQRIYKKVIGTTTTEEHYVMNGSELVAVIKNGVVSYWKTSYGRYEKSGSSYTAYYYLTDHLGSTRVVLREDGVRTEAYDYYAFGLTLPGRTLSGATKEKFTGKERDLETGWDYFGARYYNPTIARFMNVDRFSEKYPFFTPYQYAGNNPMNFIDVNGDSLDVSKIVAFDKSMQDQGQTSNVTQELVNDLSTITGVKLESVNGQIVPVTDGNGAPVQILDKNGNQTGSKIARDYLLNEVIGSKTNYTLGVGGRSIALNDNSINLGVQQIKDFKDSAMGVDSRTLGFGMVAIHELRHITAQERDGNSRQVNSFGYTGPIVEFENTIRKELGESWGQRMSYSAKEIGGRFYLPMSVAALRNMEQGRIPNTGFVNSRWRI